MSIEIGGKLKEEHFRLIRNFLATHPVTPGTRHIFSRLPHYLETSAGSLLLSGRLDDGCLAGFAVGEYASLTTAFFMFCFRAPQVAPPGTSDLLLSRLLDEAWKRGQTRMNLGLGIHQGIRFFKEKWGAVPHLSYVQASWELSSPSLFRPLRLLFRRRGTSQDPVLPHEPSRP